MKAINNKILLLTFIIISINTINAQVGIGTIQPHSSSGLDINFTNKGLLPPRLTLIERNEVENPAEGLMIYNLDDKCLNFYNGIDWVKPCMPAAKGGDIIRNVRINDELYRIHQFTTTGTNIFTVTSAGNFDYLIVAGGGGGASRHGGGGGGGGLLTSFEAEPIFLEKGTYEITIGNGGNGSPSGEQTTGEKGENSSAFGLTALGGGAGGGTTLKVNAQDGGSGGGSRGNSTAIGGTGIPGQGENGANGQLQEEDFNYGLGGGGGGYSQTGFGPNSNNGFKGRGGDGYNASTYIGVSFGDEGWFAGGGGSSSAGVPDYAGNTGGKGGGGNGNTNGQDNATPGADNTGGGGAGGGHSSNQYKGKNGGSGTIIIRYKTKILE